MGPCWKSCGNQWLRSRHCVCAKHWTKLPITRHRYQQRSQNHFNEKINKWTHKSTFCWPSFKIRGKNSSSIIFHSWWTIAWTLPRNFCSFLDTFGWSLQWSWFHSLEGMLEHHRNNCGDLRRWRSSTSLEGQLHGRLEVRRRFKRRRTRLRIQKHRIQYIFSTDEIFSPIKYIDIKKYIF